MTKDTVRAQTEEKLGLKRFDLKAVIYHSDPAWSEVVVYGSSVVANSIQADFPDADVTYKPFLDLIEVPDSTYTCSASVYGIPKGQVLLVTGSPQ
jgi:hypothetical protein